MKRIPPLSPFLLFALLGLPLFAGTNTPPQLALDLSNPHQGFVLWGSTFSPGDTVGNHYGATIFHVYIPWREAEPTDQEFDWDGVETRRLQPILDAYPNATFLLRLVADYPNGPGSGINRFYEGGDPNRDFPAWLEQPPVSVPATAYTSCNGDGPGRVPDWNHPTMINQLRELIAAFGARYDGDPRVTTIQAGLLGLWGEWHQFGCPDNQPLDAVRMAVRDAYHTAFTNTPVQVRYYRATDVAGTEHGVYEDYFPSFTAPCSWGFPLCGEYGDTILAYAIDALPEAGDNWKRSAISGESPADVQKATWLNDTADVVRAIETYHFSFLGPAGPHEDPGHTTPLAEIKRALGYQYHIAECTWPDVVAEGAPITVTIDLANTGSAPAYHDYTIEAALCSADGTPLASVRDPASLRPLLPGETRRAVLIIPSAALNPGNFSLRVGVIDPRTDQPGIRLQTPGVDARLRYPMGSVILAPAAPIQLNLDFRPGAPGPDALGLTWSSIPMLTYILEGSIDPDASTWTLHHQAIATSTLQSVELPATSIPNPQYFFRVRRQ